MSDNSIPHISNATGTNIIQLRIKKIMCTGANEPFDHPHVFLNMGEKNHILCPYCSTLYVFSQEESK